MGVGGLERNTKYVTEWFRRMQREREREYVCMRVMVRETTKRKTRLCI